MKTGLSVYVHSCMWHLCVFFLLFLVISYSYFFSACTRSSVLCACVCVIRVRRFLSVMESVCTTMFPVPPSACSFHVLYQPTQLLTICELQYGCCQFFPDVSAFVRVLILSKKNSMCRQNFPVQRESCAV